MGKYLDLWTCLPPGWGHLTIMPKVHTWALKRRPKSSDPAFGPIFIVCVSALSLYVSPYPFPWRELGGFLFAVLPYSSPFRGPFISKGFSETLESEREDAIKMEDSRVSGEEHLQNPRRNGAGTVSRIRLENFMCHSSLQIELGEWVNFITGQNGSTSCWRIEFSLFFFVFVVPWASDSDDFCILFSDFEGFLLLDSCSGRWKERDTDGVMRRVRIASARHPKGYYTEGFYKDRLQVYVFCFLLESLSFQLLSDLFC